MECLIRLFNGLTGDAAAAGRAVHGLDRGRFRSILHNSFGMTDDMLMDGGRTSVARLGQVPKGYDE